MGRIKFEDFFDKAISRICIAKSVNEAEKIEDLFSGEDIDYAIALEPYVESLFFGPGTRLNGLAFYVLSGQEGYCRILLSSKGLSITLTIEADEM